MVYKAAVIGLGRVGWLFELDEHREKPCSHVGAYLINPEIDLVAVADIDESKLKEFKSGHPSISVYADYEVMLNEAKPEIVSIATPTKTHCKIARNACRFASVRLLFVEKPLSDNVADATKMIETCKQFSVKLAVNHTRRWDPTWIHVYELVKEKISPVRKLVGICSGDPLEAGIHMADLFLWFGEGAPYHYVNLMKEKPYDPYLVFELDIFGERGRLTVADNGNRVEFYQVKESERYEGFRELEKHYGWTAVQNPSETPMLNAVEDLVKCVKENKVPRCTGQDGLEALRLALKFKEEWKDETGK